MQKKQQDGSTIHSEQKVLYHCYGSSGQSLIGSFGGSSNVILGAAAMKEDIKWGGSGESIILI